MADYDFEMGEGDNIPAVRATLLDPKTKQPLDLTGCSATLKVALQNVTTGAAIRSVTIDPDQVNNKGVVTFTFFDKGQTTKAVYEARVKLLDPDGNQMSFDGDRLVLINVTRDPGSP